jgi:hypothetical protein
MQKNREQTVVTPGPCHQILAASAAKLVSQVRYSADIRRFTHQWCYFELAFDIGERAIDFVSFAADAAGRSFKAASKPLWSWDDNSSNSGSDDWAVAARVGLNHPQFGRRKYTDRTTGRVNVVVRPFL